MTETNVERIRREALMPAFEDSSARHSVPLSWILAIARKETGFQNIRSHPGASDDKLGGAWGPMQVTSAAAAAPLGFMPRSSMEARGKAILLSAAVGIDLGAQLVARLRERVGEDLERVAAAYNAGAGAVLKGRIPTSTATQYVPAVVAFEAEYNAMIAKAS